MIYIQGRSLGDYAILNETSPNSGVLSSLAWHAPLVNLKFIESHNPTHSKNWYVKTGNLEIKFLIWNSIAPPTSTHRSPKRFFFIKKLFATNLSIMPSRRLILLGENERLQETLDRREEELARVRQEQAEIAARTAAKYQELLALREMIRLSREANPQA